VVVCGVDVVVVEAAAGKVSSTGTAVVAADVVEIGGMVGTVVVISPPDPQAASTSVNPTMSGLARNIGESLPTAQRQRAY
jgi:hypothetical protein